LNIKIYFTLLLSLFSTTVFAVECERPIKRIFTGYSASTSKIHIEHSDGYAASIVKLPFVNNDEKIVDRMLSTILSAHMGQKEITFRYLKGEDGSASSCKPTVSQITQAVWIE